MKRLIAALAMATLALPGVAAPAELVCEGTHYWYGEKSGKMPIDGIYVLVTDETVQVSGTALYSATYRIDREKSDAARVVFDLGLWAGDIKLYNGKFGLLNWTDDTKAHLINMISAKCSKADPLF